MLRWKRIIKTNGLNSFPIVGAERRSRKTRAVVKVAVGIILPRVPDGDGILYRRVGDDDLFPFELCLSGKPLVIAPGDEEPFQVSVLGDQAAVGVKERLGSAA